MTVAIVQFIDCGSELEWINKKHAESYGGTYRYWIVIRENKGASRALLYAVLLAIPKTCPVFFISSEYAKRTNFNLIIKNFRIVVFANTVLFLYGLLAQ